ncbi:hypothetical protein [Nostoc sp.]
MLTNLKNVLLAHLKGDRNSSQISKTQRVIPRAIANPHKSQKHIVD